MILSTFVLVKASTRQLIWTGWKWNKKNTHTESFQSRASSSLTISSIRRTFSSLQSDYFDWKKYKMKLFFCRPRSSASSRLILDEISNVTHQFLILEFLLGPEEMPFEAVELGFDEISVDLRFFVLFQNSKHLSSPWFIASSGFSPSSFSTVSNWFHNFSSSA